MWFLNRLFFTTLLTLLALNLISCTSAKLNAVIYPSSYLNPNINNQASPVVLTIFQLKSPDRFNKSAMFALLNDPSLALGDDMLDKREVEVRPAKSEKIDMALLPAANYIGVIGGFREADKSVWRRAVVITPGKSLNIQINVTAKGLEIK